MNVQRTRGNRRTRWVGRWSMVFWVVLPVALAKPADPRGWSDGTPAVGAARVLVGPDRSALPKLDFPKAFARRLTGRTLLFYFSPTCPHCRNVGAEIGTLARALPPSVRTIGIATGSSDPADVEAFKKAYDLDFPVVIDTDRKIGAAMGVRSTPSVLLVEPEGKKHAIVDLWYPYQPGYQLYVRMRVAEDPWSVFDGYLGTAACAGCHQQEAEAWALTPHAAALRTLERHGKADDPACIGCHVTGHGEEGGWSPEKPYLGDVGCEACHGPSGPHDGERTEPRTVCVACHDEEHSIQFSVEKGLPLIDHFAAVALDDEAFRERRKAVLEGTVPRTLLAFAPDPTVGAEACKSCHPAEYAHWAGSPHRQAMEVLIREGRASDPACVRCHATANRGGPPPESLDGFRVDEGVGCEPCHGPGKAHVDAGGTAETIEKLGDDCPVCVIESVCTGCHVPAWDKDWALDTHLPRVGHGTVDKR